jgi:hypothetical protein
VSWGFLCFLLDRGGGTKGTVKQRVFEKETRVC